MPDHDQGRSPAASAPTEVTAIRRRDRSVVLGLGLIGLGIAIAVGGGAMILALKAPTASTYLVSPDLPIEAGDAVTLRRGDASCATTVRLVLPGGNLIVAECAGGALDVEVPRGALSVEAYRPGEREPAIGDVVIVRSRDSFVRARVLGREGDRRIRLDHESAPGAEWTVEARTAFVVRRSPGG